MITVLVQSLNKRHMKYVFHKFRIIFQDQKTLSLIFKSSRSQMIFKIGVLKHYAIFTRKYLCWSYFLIKLQAWRPTILLKRDSNTDIFLEYCETFKNICFKEYLRTAASVLLIQKLVIITEHLPSLPQCGMVRFVDLVRVHSLLIISRNHSNTFLLKPKLVQSKILQHGLFVLIFVLISTGWCPLLKVYFNDAKNHVS